MQKNFSKRIQNLTPSGTIGIQVEVSRRIAAGLPVVNLSLGEPDFATPRNVSRKAVEAIKSGYTHYTPVSGIKPLRELIAKKLFEDNGVSYTPDEIIVGVGTKQILYAVFQVLCEKGDEVLIPAPTWSTYAEQAKLAGASVVLVPLKPPFELTSRDVEKHISPATKVLVINSPSNPTGAVISERELKKIARIAVRENIFVISDEIYEKILYEKKHCSIASFGEDIKRLTITVNGFSKAYAMTGWRIGYAAASKEIITALDILSGQMTFGTCSISQYAALEALRGTSVSVDKMRAEFRRRRDFVCRELSKIEGISFTRPNGAFYVLLDVGKLLGGTYKTSEAWTRALLDSEGVAAVAGEAFFAPGYVRLSFSAGMGELKKGIEKISSFISNQ